MLLLSAMVLTLLVASGVVLAVPRIGDDAPNILVGTNREDSLLERGDDKTFGGAGAD
jgi:hypothetical protein